MVGRIVVTRGPVRGVGRVQVAIKCRVVVSAIIPKTDIEVQP